jgi:hypothetical protein
MSEEYTTLDVQAIDEYMTNIIDHARHDQEWYAEFKCPYCEKNLCDYLVWNGEYIEQNIPRKHETICV